jgi:hypothetical protein
MQDSRLYTDFFKSDQANGIDYDAFEREIDWRPMTIGGRELCRRGCFQGRPRRPVESGEELPQGRPATHGDVPWLRCPSIEEQDILPLTPTVQALMDHINTYFGVETNIVKIQRYDDGKAFIRAHSDKVLDLAPDVPIFNYRIGATRNLVMTHKVTKERHCVPMPHNSLFVIGPQTNREWLHGIEVEDMDEPSISMIFRQSVTFKAPDGSLSGPTAHLCAGSNKQLISAYGTENKTVYHSHEEALQAYA